METNAKIIDTDARQPSGATSCHRKRIQGWSIVSHPASTAVSRATMPVSGPVSPSAPSFDLDLLLDALKVVAFVVVLLLLGIGQNLIGFSNLLEHLLGVFSAGLVQVPLLVWMPLRGLLAIGLLDLQLRGDR